MVRHLSPRYGQGILVSGYLLLTAANWSQHWYPTCVSVFLCSDPKLARKYEIEHWSRSSKTINWPGGSFQINHVTSMSWQMSPRYGQWLSCFDSCQLTILWMSNVKDVDLPSLRHPSLPFDSLPYPTRTIRRRLGTYVRTLGQSRDN